TSEETNNEHESTFHENINASCSSSQIQAFESNIILNNTTSHDDKLFKNWLHRFALKQGFNYKIRTSETIEDVLQKVIYEYIKLDTNNLQVILDLIQQ
ncbi:13384_t:CDS:2, partial [Cetraspora pellucida]